MKIGDVLDATSTLQNTIAKERAEETMLWCLFDKSRTGQNYLHHKVFEIIP